MDDFELPLFPLHTVLFPDGPLALRIFEPRYLDMISRCLRTDAAFGVCLIREGSETGPVKPAPVGTLARIVDWQPRGDGLLGISAHGGQRFALDQVRTQKDGLHLGRARLLEADPPMPLPPEWRPLTTLLRQIMTQLESQYRGLAPDFDDAAWVGHRYAEILPVPLPQKQVLLEMTNPLERLRMLRPMVEAVRRRG